MSRGKEKVEDAERGEGCRRRYLGDESGRRWVGDVGRSGGEAIGGKNYEKGWRVWWSEWTLI